MSKHTILFLAANPVGTDRLALDEEARAIQVELERSGHRDQFELVTRWAARSLDLLRELRKLKPTIVHFCGHGAGNGIGAGGGLSRDVVGEVSSATGERGLFFRGPNGHSQLVSTAALEETFEAAGGSVKVVVLSACYSDAQAASLAVHVGCVVGVAGSICDDAARIFAIGFYGALGEHESVAAAFRQGCAAVSLAGLRGPDGPQLRVRDGTDPARLVLAEKALVARSGIRVRSRRLVFAIAIAIGGWTVTMHVVSVRSAPDCARADVTSSMCTYRGTLRHTDGRPANGMLVELLGTDCTVTTTDFGVFDFSKCDVNQTRRLLHPKIVLPELGPDRCREIPLQMPPLMTDARFDEERCLSTAFMLARAIQPQD